MSTSPILGLSHLTFIVRNVDRTARLFCEGLGAQEVYDSQGRNFSLSREKFVLLDSTGALSILNYKGEAATGAAFEFAGKVQITTADLTTMPTGSQLQLAISAADDKVYVTDPLSKTVSTVDLAEAEVTDKQELGFTPHKLVWLGIAAAHDH